MSEQPEANLHEAIDPLEVMVNLEPLEPLDQRWLNSQPALVRGWHKIRENKYAQISIGYVASMISGVIARDGFDSFPYSIVPAALDTLNERILGSMGVDTGPATMSHLKPEGVSNVLFGMSSLYLLGGEGIDLFIYNKNVKRGLAHLPITNKKIPELIRGKAWKDHTIVIDPNQLIFDSFSAAMPDSQLVLVHDGNPTVAHEDGSLKGDDFGLRDLRRHINAIGADHLSDDDVLSRARPENAQKIIINLWRPDAALYSAIFAASDSSSVYSVAKVDNIIRTLASLNATGDIQVLLPKGEKWQFDEDAKILLEGGTYGTMGVSVINPEDLVINMLDEKLKSEKISGDNQVIVVSDIETTQGQKKVLLKDVFESDMKQKGISVSSSETDAQVIIVYCSTDDVSNAKAAQVSKRYPDKKVIVMVENSSNANEAKHTGASAWYLPGIISSSLK